MKLVKRFIPLLLACACLLSTTSFASDKASDQIVSYYINAGAIGQGKINIDFSITCPGIMKEVGAQEIYIYEITPYGLDERVHYDTEDVDMISTDTWVHANYKTYYGSVGKTYYITVSVYAKDYNNKSDSRSQSFTVTAT